MRSCNGYACSFSKTLKEALPHFSSRIRNRLASSPLQGRLPLLLTPGLKSGFAKCIFPNLLKVCRSLGEIDRFYAFNDALKGYLFLTLDDFIPEFTCKLAIAS
ncbi:hypothetical protein SAMN02927923_01219 [Microvirga guangxiensis]|uniref:Uncharacterized protein n=1 Tax=Microvirga guangxiensis TaxID=549386 RepID=A0A1G5F4S0_9HYPH|nr:hypothetical protein SAMN02927923_01219 [Microvirga guangxiensis]